MLEYFQGSVSVVNKIQVVWKTYNNRLPNSIFAMVFITRSVSSSCSIYFTLHKCKLSQKTYRRYKSAYLQKFEVFYVSEEIIKFIL